MLNSLGKVSAYIRLFSWVCVCMRRQRLSTDLIERIRPVRIWGYLCWCDRRS